MNLPAPLPILAPALAAVMISCAPERAAGEDAIPVVDVRADYPVREIVLQDIARVEYVALETREGFLIDHYSRLRYMDERIAAISNNSGRIMIFDRLTGRAVSSFDRTGRGPGEYTGVLQMTVDAAAGEIFVADANSSAVLVYDMTGRPLRRLDPRRNLGPMDFLHSRDDGYLMFYSPWNPRRPDRVPFRLLSKSDTTTVDLPVRLAGRDNMDVRHVFPGGSSMIARKWDLYLARTGDGYMISEPGVDTIYRWDGRSEGLTPVMARTPAWRSMEHPVGLFWMARSGPYTFLQTVERRVDIDPGVTLMEYASGPPVEHPTVSLVFDHTDGTIGRATIVNDDFADRREFVPQNNIGLPAGTFAASLQPFELIETHRQGGLRGQLAEAAATLGEQDNPVMMTVTLK